MIVDSHCHAWRRWPYEPPVPDPETRGSVEQLLFELERNGVDQAVLICARIGGNDDNVDYALDAAARHPDRLHAFPDVDCYWSPDHHAPGAAAEQLRALLARGPLSGVSHYTHPENDGWLRAQAARDLFALAAEHDLILSLAIHPAWLADLCRLAADFPTLPVICSHLGLSRTPQELEQVLACAAVPSILTKVSALYAAAAPGRMWDFPYPRTHAREAVQRIYERFGPQRMCWGSDFPVILEHLTYRQSLELCRTHCDFVPPAEQALVLGETFARVHATRRPLA